MVVRIKELVYTFLFQIVFCYRVIELLVALNNIMHCRYFLLILLVLVYYLLYTLVFFYKFKTRTLNLFSKEFSVLFKLQILGEILIRHNCIMIVLCVSSIVINNLLDILILIDELICILISFYGISSLANFLVLHKLIQLYFH